MVFNTGWNNLGKLDRMTSIAEAVVREVNRRANEVEGSRSSDFFPYMEGQTVVDVSTDLATQLTLIKELLYLKMSEGDTYYPTDSEKDQRGRMKIAALTDAQIEDAAYSILYGYQVLAEARLDLIKEKFAKNVAGDDTTAGKPWQVTTRDGFRKKIQNIELSPFSILLAEFFTPVFQMTAKEVLTAENGCYYCPAILWATAADMEAAFRNLEIQHGSYAVHDAIGYPLVKVSRQWLETLFIYPWDSDLGEVYAYGQAFKVESTLTDHEFSDVESDKYSSQSPGVTPLWGALALLRPVGATATPGWTDVGTVAASKLSISYLATIDASAFTACPDTSNIFNGFHRAAAALGDAQTGVFSSESPNMVKIGTYGSASAQGWNDRVKEWMGNWAVHKGHVWALAKVGVIPDRSIPTPWVDRSMQVGARVPGESLLDALVFPLRNVRDAVDGVREDVLSEMSVAVRSACVSAGAKAAEVPLVTSLKKKGNKPSQLVAALNRLPKNSTVARLYSSVMTKIRNKIDNMEGVAGELVTALMKK